MEKGQRTVTLRPTWFPGRQNLIVLYLSFEHLSGAADRRGCHLIHTQNQQATEPLVRQRGQPDTGEGGCGQQELLKGKEEDSWKPSEQRNPKENF